MFFSKSKVKIGDIKTINGISCVYCSGRWIPMVYDGDDQSVTNTIHTVIKHVSNYIRSENVYIDNNPVLQDLPKDSRFPHILFLINYTETHDPLILEMYKAGLSDDQHSNSYTRWLETMIAIEVESSTSALSILASRYIRAIMLHKPTASLRGICTALSTFPWLYLLPIYNEVYTSLGMDLD